MTCLLWEKTLRKRKASSSITCFMWSDSCVCISCEVEGQTWPTAQCSGFKMAVLQKGKTNLIRVRSSSYIHSAQHFHCMIHTPSHVTCARSCADRLWERSRCFFWLNFLWITVESEENGEEICFRGLNFLERCQTVAQSSKWVESVNAQSSTVNGYDSATTNTS